MAHPRPVCLDDTGTKPDAVWPIQPATHQPAGNPRSGALIHAFAETMEKVRERLDAMLPKVPLPGSPGMPNPTVAKLLMWDAEKRERQKCL